MTILFSILAFFLPTQLSYHFKFLNISVMSFNVDYLIPGFYFTDIVVCLIIILHLLQNKVRLTKKTFLLWSIYLFLIIVNIYSSDFLISTLYKWIKLTEFLVLGLIIKNNKDFDFFKHFVKPLSYSMIVVNILSVLQFLNKGSIGGIFYYLGERNYVFTDPNVAPYPYSTFSHSNSYAGFLLIFTIFALLYRRRYVHSFFYLSLSLNVVNLFLTNSLNVYLTIFMLFLILISKKMNNLKLKNLALVPFTFIDLNQRYITHRIELMQSSLQMIREKPFFGVGLNNFIPKLSTISNLYLTSWELQPVHNIFLLAISETGFIGGIMLIMLVYSGLSFLNFPLIAVLITGMSDHYWITLQQNMLLFTFVLIYNYKRKKYKYYDNLL